MQTVRCRYLRLNGVQCTIPAVDPDAEVILCGKHLLRTRPGLDGLHVALFGAERVERGDHIDKDQAVKAQLQRAAGLVYYVRAWGYIKIGTTTAISARLAELKATEVLATEPGSYDIERHRHRQFVRHRHIGEYFHPDPEIIEFTEKLRARYGPPITTTAEQMAVSAERLGAVPGEAGDAAGLGAARLADTFRTRRDALRPH